MVKTVLIVGSYDTKLKPKASSEDNFWSHAFVENNVRDIDFYNFDNQIKKHLHYFNKLTYNLTSRIFFDIFKRAEYAFLEYLKDKKYDLIVVLKGEYIRKELLLKIRTLQKDTAIINLFPDNPFFYFYSYLAIPQYDFFFVKDSYVIQELKKSGYYNCHYLPQPCSSILHKKLNRSDFSEKDVLKYSSDVAFVGSIYPQRQRILENLQGFDLKIWGRAIWDSVEKDSWILKQHQHEIADDDKKCKIFNFSKIVLNTHNYQNDIFGCNRRLFEICGCRGFQLVDYKPDIEKVFKPGKELVTYSSSKEMRELVRYYLDAPQERENIAARGYRRAHKDHTYTKRIQDILKMIRDGKR